jgi:hypothetical protein
MKQNKIARSDKTIKSHGECKQFSLFDDELDKSKVESKSNLARHFTKGMSFTIKL